MPLPMSGGRANDKRMPGRAQTPVCQRLQAMTVAGFGDEKVTYVRLPWPIADIPSGFPADFEVFRIQCFACIEGDANDGPQR